MKTTIALPDVLRSAADAFAHRHGVTRQELVLEALREYLRRHRAVARPVLKRQAAHQA